MSKRKQRSNPKRISQEPESVGSTGEGIDSHLELLCDERPFLFLDNDTPEDPEIAAEVNDSKAKELRRYASERFDGVLERLEDCSELDTVDEEGLGQYESDFEFMLAVQSIATEFKGVEATIAEINEMLKDDVFVLIYLDTFLGLAVNDLAREVQGYTRDIDLKDIKQFCERNPIRATHLLHHLNKAMPSALVISPDPKRLPHNLTATLRNIRKGNYDRSITLRELPLTVEARNRIKIWELLKAEKRGVYTGLTSMRSSRLLYLAAMTSSSEESLGADIFVDNLIETPQREDIRKSAAFAIGSLQAGSPVLSEIESSSGAADGLDLLEHFGHTEMISFLEEVSEIFFRNRSYSAELRTSAEMLLVELGESLFEVDVNSDTLGRDLAIATTPPLEDRDTVYEESVQNLERYFADLDNNHERIAVAMILMLRERAYWSPDVYDFLTEEVSRLIWEHGVDPNAWKTAIDYEEGVFGYGDISDRYGMADVGVATRYVITEMSGALSSSSVYTDEKMRAPTYRQKSAAEFLYDTIKRTPGKTLLGSPFRRSELGENQYMSEVQTRISMFLLGATLKQLRGGLKENESKSPITPYPFSLSELLVSIEKDFNIDEVADKMLQIDQSYDTIAQESVIKMLARVPRSELRGFDDYKKREFIVDFLRGVEEEFFGNMARKVMSKFGVERDLTSDELAALREYTIHGYISTIPYLLTPPSSTELELLWYLLGGRDIEIASHSTIDHSEFWNFESLLEHATEIAKPGEDPEIISQNLFKRLIRLISLTYERASKSPDRHNDLTLAIIKGMSLGGTPAHAYLQREALQRVFDGETTYIVDSQRNHSIFQVGMQNRSARKESPRRAQPEVIARIDDFHDDLMSLQDITLHNALLSYVVELERSWKVEPLYIPERFHGEIVRGMSYLLPGLSKDTLLNFAVVVLSSSTIRSSLENWIAFENSQEELLAKYDSTTGMAHKAWHFLLKLTEGAVTISPEGPILSVNETLDTDTTVEEKLIPQPDLLGRVKLYRSRAEKLLKEIEENPDYLEVSSRRSAQIEDFRRFISNASLLEVNEMRVKRDFGKYTRQSLKKRSTQDADDEFIRTWLRMMSAVDPTSLTEIEVTKAVAQTIWSKQSDDLQSLTARLDGNPLFWSMSRVYDKFGSVQVGHILSTLFNKIPRFPMESTLISVLVNDSNMSIDLDNLDQVNEAVSKLLERLEILATVIEESKDTNKVEEIVVKTQDEGEPKEGTSTKPQKRKRKRKGTSADQQHARTGVLDPKRGIRGAISPDEYLEDEY